MEQSWWEFIQMCAAREHIHKEVDIYATRCLANFCLYKAKGNALVPDLAKAFGNL